MVKSKLSPHSGFATVMQLNPIHKNGSKSCSFFLKKLIVERLSPYVKDVVKFILKKSTLWRQFHFHYRVP